MIPTLEEVQAAYRATDTYPTSGTTGSSLHLGRCAVGALFQALTGRMTVSTEEACETLDIDQSFTDGFDYGFYLSCFLGAQASESIPYCEDDPWTRGALLGQAIAEWESYGMP